MAKRSVVYITDDIDGTEGAETVSFAFDGRTYEIDLSEDNRKALEQALEPYISAGRKTASATRSASRPSRSNNAAELGKIRDWAEENGMSVSKRGRISQSVMDAYNAAH